MGRITLTTIDRESKSTSLSIGADDAVGGVAVQALADAVDAVILGSDVQAVSTVATVVDAGSDEPPNEPFANRGNKWIFRTQVALENGKIYTNEIGTADNAQLPSASSDFLDLTAGVGLALKTAWDAVFESDDGNPGVLLSVQQINRGLN